MRRALVGAGMLLLVGAVGCSKTWVDDEGNFERLSGFKMGPSVQVVHSYYREDKTWLGSTYKTFFFQLRLPESKPNDEKRREKFYINEIPDARSRYGCDPNPPSWFVSKAPEHYEMWVMKDAASFREFHDKDDGMTFVCGGRGGT